MLKINKVTQITYSDILKKVNYQLTSNFFSLKEFSELKFRKACKVIKLISKINNIKLKRNQVHLLAREIQALYVSAGKQEVKIQTISSFFNWNITLVRKSKIKFVAFINHFISYIFIFRLDRKKIFRI